MHEVLTCIQIQSGETFTACAEIRGPMSMSTRAPIMWISLSISSVRNLYKEFGVPILKNIYIFLLEYNCFTMLC